ncbi:hypothetical protein B0H14DRAFT_3453506 [Mycena olivaceomarginata]|nr:hypothetical protein B0H14DRAFT_3453506 [Mycena olivaceomarginata]
MYALSRFQFSSVIQSQEISQHVRHLFAPYELGPHLDLIFASLFGRSKPGARPRSKGSIVIGFMSYELWSKSMDSFTTAKKIEDVLPPVNEDGGTGSSGSCVVCKEDGSLPTINEDGGTGSSGSCVIA